LSPLLGGLRPTAVVKQAAVGGNTTLFSDLISNKIVVGNCMVPRKRERVDDAAGAGLIMEGHDALLVVVQGDLFSH
jgi:hypothetical protein